MKTFRILISFLLGFILIGCNNENNLLTSEKKGLKSRNDFDPKNKVGYVLNEEEIKEVALAVPLEYSTSHNTKSGLITKKIKETIPFNQTKWGKKSLQVTKSIGKEKSLIEDVYIINYEGNEGFTILSANNQTERVLAYSDYGNLTDNSELPAGLVIFLDNLPAYITSVTNEIHPYPTDSVDENGFYYCNPIYYYGNVEIESVNPKIQAQWGQHFPYNNECPVIMDEIRYNIGCVAVSLGQIMSYHKYPTSIYSERYQTYFSLDWNLYPTQFTELNNGSKAIAALLKKIANCTSMQFTPQTGVTGAATISDAYNGLALMGYTSESVCFYNPEHIINSLNSSRPVLISGIKNTGTGHAWIVDGYRKETNRYYCDWDVYNDLTGEYVGVWTTIVDPSLDHIESLIWYYNWGWNGLYDGYYTAGVYQTSNGNYNQDIRLIPNIRKL